MKKPTYVLPVLDGAMRSINHQQGTLAAIVPPFFSGSPRHAELPAAFVEDFHAIGAQVGHLLRRGLREPDENGAWTHPWWRWVQSLKFEHEAQQVALADCIAEVLHMGERLARLDKAIDRLVESAPAHMRAVIEALQALRGVAKLSGGRNCVHLCAKSLRT